MNHPRCRVCGKENGAHTPAALIPRVPHDGDVSLCLYCQTSSVFEGGVLREPTRDEQTWIDTNPECVRAARVVAMVVRGGKS
jgi:hypothetical protein